jgi:hypothetical protein
MECHAAGVKARRFSLWSALRGKRGRSPHPQFNREEFMRHYHSRTFCAGLLLVQFLRKASSDQGWAKWLNQQTMSSAMNREESTSCVVNKKN